MKLFQKKPANAEGYSYLDPLIEQQRQFKMLGIAVAVILMLSAAVGAIIFYRPARIAPQQLTDIVQNNIKAQLSFATDLNFTELQADRKGDDYYVSGAVSAIMSTGETARFKFSCVVRRNREGSWLPGKWEVDRLR